MKERVELINNVALLALLITIYGKCGFICSLRIFAITIALKEKPSYYCMEHILHFNQPIYIWSDRQ